MNLFQKKEKGIRELMEENMKLKDIDKVEDERVSDLIIRLEQVINNDETAIELFEEIIGSIETVYETNTGERVLDVNLEYRNYKWNTRHNYSKRFKNEDGEVKDNESKQNN